MKLLQENWLIGSLAPEQWINWIKFIKWELQNIIQEGKSNFQENPTLLLPHTGIKLLSPLFCNSGTFSFQGMTLNWKHVK